MRKLVCFIRMVFRPIWQQKESHLTFGTDRSSPFHTLGYDTVSGDDRFYMNNCEGGQIS